MSTIALVLVDQWASVNLLIHITDIIGRNAIIVIAGVVAKYHDTSTSNDPNPLTLTCKTATLQLIITTQSTCNYAVLKHYKLTKLSNPSINIIA